MDDSTLFELCEINSISLMQESVNIAAEWTNNNDMKINSEKSKEMIISFSHLLLLLLLLYLFTLIIIIIVIFIIFTLIIIIIIIFIIINIYYYYYYNIYIGPYRTSLS